MPAERVWVCVMMIISIRSRMQSLICLLGLCQVTALSGAEMFFPRREREKRKREDCVESSNVTGGCEKCHVKVGEYGDMVILSVEGIWKRVRSGCRQQERLDMMLFLQRYIGY